ncbi:hypothetical protein TRICI_002529 [Trichomonascus ciferrii]|uniref:NmrA-like domain-containing protein n=1 Tax=Trichomonascus ciferrii TaxID=44093 RepID=A0A642V6D0_9ASCO|nr:hypothetical protein TRICI_002529 [Trichomonascus ciferrii]
MSSTKPQIAIFGLNGQLGQEFIKAFTKYASTEDVEYVKADINDAESLKAALDGVNVVVDVTGHSVSSKPLIDAAVEAGVGLFFNSEFGSDISVPNMKWFPEAYALKLEEASYARQHSQLKTVSVRNDVFADFVLPVAHGLFGVDSKTKTAIKYEGYKNKFTVTWVSNIAKAVASIAYKDPKSLPDVVKLHGSSVSGKDVIEYFENKEGTKFELTTVSWEDTKKLATESDEKLKNKQFSSSQEAFGLFVNIIRAYLLDPEERRVVDFANNNNNDLTDVEFRKWYE